MSSPTDFSFDVTQLTATSIHDEGDWTEGPQVFKIDGTYYMTYSGNNWQSPRYQIHFAKGSSILGLEPQNNNPVFSQFTGSLTGTGHNIIALGPDLVSYYSIYHCITPIGIVERDRRKIAVDKIWVDEATGNIMTDGPNFELQPDPSSPW